MPDFDAMFEALKVEIQSLSGQFLNQFLPANPEHKPENFQYQIKAFSVLSHAAFEHYVESVSEAMLKKVESDFLGKKTSLSTLCLISAYGIAITLPQNDGDDETSCFDHIRKAIDEAKKQHSALLKDNHGVSAKYIRKLLIPVGINMPTGPKMDSLNKLAEARGTFAHTMTEHAKYGGYKKAIKILTPEAAKDAVDDCLLVCETIKDRAKATF